jgi:hypothetical protein
MFKNQKMLLICSSVFLTAVLLFGAFLPALAVEETDNQPTLPQELLLKLTLKSIDRVVLRESDMNSYSWLIFMDLIDCFPTVLTLGENGVQEVVLYPDEYAGAFIDEANRLHIVLTKPVDGETAYDYRAITGYDETVIFDIAQYPLSVLNEVQNTLNSVIEEFGICATSLNEYINKIDVHLYDRTRGRELVEFLKTKFDNFNEDCLIFKDPNSNVPEASNGFGNALGGSQTTRSGGSGTVGFNAYRAADGKYGMVTASHVAPSGRTMSNAVGTTIGTPTISTYGGTIDAAFVPFPDGILGIGKITQSDQFYGSYPANDDYFTGYLPNGAYLVTGLSTDKIGDNTGHTKGEVFTPNYAFGNFTDLLGYRNQHADGDSGGPVFHAIQLQAQRDINVLLAIHCFASNTTLDCSGSKVWNIVSGLGITPYTYNVQYSYVDSIITALPSGSGSVTNANGMKGRVPDGDLANIKGVAANAGGKIVAQFNQGTKGDIWIYANSVSGYNTDFYTFAAYNNNNVNDWTQTMCTTLQSNNNRVWINCGFYTKNDARYFSIAALNDGGNAANINIDAVIIVPR